MNELSQIAERTGTDKWSLHRYTEYYGRLLEPLRHQPVTMLEIGVLGGNSLMMWDGWFDHPDARIFGVDIHERWLPGKGTRMNVMTGNGADPSFLMEVIRATGPLDLVIDDGSHFSNQQIYSLGTLWQFVKPGGLYIVEDTHTSYTAPWTSRNETSFIESMRTWIDDLNENGKDHCGVPTESTIDEITFRKSLMVMRKR